MTRQRRWVGAAVLGAAVLAGWTARAQEEMPQASRPDASSAEQLRGRLERSLEAGNVENTLYYYRSLYHITGVENAPLLGKVAEIVLEREARHGVSWIRIEAASFLARRGDAEAVKVLEGQAVDLDVAPTLRHGAVVALGDSGQKDALDTLKIVMEDLNRPASERLAAMDAILALGDVSAVHYLAMVVRDGERAHRGRALRILGDRRAPALDSLRRAAADEDPDIRLLALRALGLRADPWALETLRAEFGDDPEVVIPSEPLDPAEALALSEGATDWAEAIDFHEVNRLHLIGEILLENDDPRPVAYFHQLIDEPNVPFDRAELADAIAGVDRELGLKLLRNVLEGSGLGERVSAAKLLAELGEVHGLAEVVSKVYGAAGFENAAEPLRMYAIAALVDFADLAAAPTLSQALEDPSGIVRIQAAHGLAKLGDLAGLHLLRKMLDGSDRVNAVKAAEALVEIAEIPAVGRIRLVPAPPE